jgi:cytochrome c-type biogenesis protein CcmH
MILFWIICALFIVLALAFVLPPLLQQSPELQAGTDQERREANVAIYRDQLSELETDLHNGLVSQQQYDQDREEIERRLLEDTTADGELNSKVNPPTTGSRSTAYVLALGLPLVAVLFYLKVGDLKGIARVPTEPPVAEESSTGSTERSQAQIEANVAALAKRLENNPSDAQGWSTLARSYSSMEKYADAAVAYEKAIAVKTDDADLLAEYAFATAMASNRQLQGKPTDLINRALKLDPENLKALELAGSAAYQAKDYKKAIDYWQRMVSKVPPGSDLAQSVNSRISEAKALVDGK